MTPYLCNSSDRDGHTLLCVDFWTLHLQGHHVEGKSLDLLDTGQDENTPTGDVRGFAEAAAWEKKINYERNNNKYK